MIGFKKSILDFLKETHPKLLMSYVKTQRFLLSVYSCFDKGCPTIAYAMMRIGVIGRKSLALID